MKIFNRMIEKTIEHLEGDIFIINLNKQITCLCRKTGSSEPDAKCPLCLGTGYKIKIKKAKGACQDSKLAATVRETTSVVITKTFYVKAMYHIDRDDILISNNEIFYVYESKKLKTKGNVDLYMQHLCTDKKYDTEEFFKNFNKIIGRR